MWGRGADWLGSMGRNAPSSPYKTSVHLWPSTQPSQAADTSIKANMHRHKLSPYTDKLLLGKAVMTVASGHVMHLHAAIQVREERGI